MVIHYAKNMVGTAVFGCRKMLRACPKKVMMAVERMESLDAVLINPKALNAVRSWVLQALLRLPVGSQWDFIRHMRMVEKSGRNWIPSLMLLAHMIDA